MSGTKVIRSILFDLDRTLLDRDASVLAFAAAQHARFALRLDGAPLEAYVETFIRLDDRGMLWKDAVYQRLTVDLGIGAVPWEELYQDFTDRIVDHYIAFPGVHEALVELSAHHTLGLVTNGRTFFQNRTIATLGLAPYFSTVLISEKESLRKPDVAIFHRALSHLEVAPHEAVYVGDHPVNDMQAARNAGMHTVWKRNDDFPDAPCDARFDDFNELPGIIRALPALF